MEKSPHPGEKWWSHALIVAAALATALATVLATSLATASAPAAETKAEAPAKFAELVSCVRSVTSHVRSEWQPETGAIVCEAELQKCLLAVPNGEVESFALPKNPAYSVEAIDIDLSDSPHVYRHFLISLSGKKTGKKIRAPSVALDVFGAVGRGLFQRKITVYGSKLVPKADFKTDSAVAFVDIARPRVERAFEVLARNIAAKSFPPGISAEAYLASVQKRLGGCLEYDARAATIVEQAKELVPQPAK